MAITLISRDWGISPSIVRIVTTDTVQVTLGADYILNQAANISIANNGPFTWNANDYVLISGSNGNSPLLTISADLSSLVSITGSFSLAVPMTAAQWNGMYAAPFLLVPAPGVNRLIVVNSSQWALKFNSASYASGGATQLQYENTVHGAGVAASASVAAATINALAASTVENVAGVASVVNANTVNQGVYISNATGAYTTGDGPWVITVNYSIIQTA